MRNTQGNLPSLLQREELVLDEPCIEQVHKWIMYHIDWIGYISQELAYLGRFFYPLWYRKLPTRREPEKR